MRVRYAIRWSRVTEAVAIALSAAAVIAAVSGVV